MPPANSARFNVPQKHTYKRPRRRRRVAPVLILAAIGLFIVYALVAFVHMLWPRPQSALPKDVDPAPPKSVFRLPKEPVSEETAAALKTLHGVQGEYPGLADVLENPGHYPENLIALAARKPETIPFLLGYPTRKTPTAPADISPELNAGGIPAFYQWDTRWGYASYAGGMLGVTGCGPTCLAMAACGLLQDPSLDPLSIAQFAENGGHCDPGYGTSWSLFSQGAEELGLACYGLGLDESMLYNAVASGDPVIISVGPGDFTTTGHFILLAGIADDGNYIVHDPNSMLNSSKTWSYAQLAPQSKALWGFSRP